MDISINKSGRNGRQKYNVSIEGRLSMKEYRIQNKVRSNPPSSYTTNNEHEKNCIQIINELLERSANDDKLSSRLSLLTALNEFHIRKCVCSTIKPKLLPYPEVYDVTSCSKFVANFFNYEPLKDPYQPPNHLVSPTQTIEWGIGDCFDLAIVLASFLIGAGYDTYVVYGTAPKWICQRDKSRTSTYYDHDKTFVENNIDSNYQSACLKDQKETSTNIVNPTNTYCDQVESHAINNDDDNVYDYYGDDGVDDDKENRLIHCWLLVKPGLRNDINSTIFVEPSTGQIYPCKLKSPYVEVFAVWNTKNYWINLSCKNASGDLSLFDPLHGNKQWLPVFHNTPSRFYQANTASLLNIQNTAVKPFDPSISWVQNLHIHPHLYEFRYPPNGQRASHFKTSKVELFSPKQDRQSVLRRDTKYKDQAHVYVIECCETFGDDTRMDCLIKRVKRPMEMYYHECFSKKHKHALTEYIEVIGVKREMKFQAKSRKDGLQSREETFQQQIIEKYSGRPDRLSKRTIYLTMLDEKGTLVHDSKPVLKLTSIENPDTMIVKRIE